MALASLSADEIKQITGGSYAVSDEKINSYVNKINSYKNEIEDIKNAPPKAQLDPEWYTKAYRLSSFTGGLSPQEHYDRQGRARGASRNEDEEYTKFGRLSPERAAKIREIEAKIPPLESFLEKIKVPGDRQSRVPSELVFSAKDNYGQSDLASKLNYQISDEQILNDINTSKQNRLSKIIQDGNAQVLGINERIKFAESLLNNIPAKDPSRAQSEVFINQLKNDLTAVTSAITSAQDMQKNFKPITADSPEALKEITAFRSFVQLPEERASQQLYQIDPDAYRTSVALGQSYRQMAEAPIGATTTPETEQLRQTIEEEAINQLRLGSTIGAEERRGYEQAIRGAQTARGNIFGLGPAVQEASQIGAAGEQRKLARYGAAQAFLGSGQTTGDALKADLAFRDALQQNRLGAASGFIAGGPSIGNLAQARTGQQQAAFQNYIQANQALPGGFNQQPSTAAPFYSAVDQQIPVQLTNAFTNLYNAQADYQASTYGAQVGALSRQPNGFQNFATLAGGFKDIAGGFGGLASAGILCWVAREVYGEDNPKWLQFREWMLTRASDNLRNYYIEYGERIAESIRNRPKVKDIIRRWMDKKVKEMYGS